MDGFTSKQEAEDKTLIQIGERKVLETLYPCPEGFIAKTRAFILTRVVQAFYQN